MINFDKFLASFITEMKKYTPITSYNIPACIKKALEDQGLAYKDGEIIQTQRRISAEAKEAGYGESKDERVKYCIGVCLLADAKEQRFKECGTNINECLTWLEEQKPTWTEEDESMYTRTLGILGKCYMGELPTKVEDELKWLKSLKKHIVPQSIQEWTKEDELKLQSAIEICENSGHTLTSDWLKLLKDRVSPKQEWTKEDKERYISCLQRLGTGNPEQPETINSKWFKEHVYPQKQWKPNNEQMCAFKQMYDWYNTHFAQSLALNSLYNDLKKLKGE